MDQEVPIKAPTWTPPNYSADGTHYWNGQQWVDLTRGPVALPPTPVNNVFHLLMSVFTLGLWFPVWMMILIFRRRRYVKQMVWNGKVWRPVTSPSSAPPVPGPGGASGPA